MAKVYIGVGHGGTDSGAVANGIKEKEYNLDVAKSCKDELQRHGVSVMISRESDVTENLSARIKECNTYNPDFAIDVHHNAGGGDGAEVFHSKKDTKDDALAKNILDEIVKIGQNSRGLKTRLLDDGRDYYGFIRQVKCPSALVECAFIDNATDVKIVDTLAERKTMGIAIAKGILKTLGITYKAATSATSFLPARGYFKKGDTHENIGKIASFMRKCFPSYTSEKALGNYYGDNLVKAVKEFQKRTGLEPDGYFGKLTLAKLKTFGFKE